MDRNLELSNREENIREARPRPVQFELSQIKSHFDESLQSIEKQFIVYDELAAAGKVEESKNILRSQIVFIEGILDFYIHEMSKYAMYRMFKGDWRASEKFGNFSVPMNQVEKAYEGMGAKDWFFDFLNERFSREVYLSAESMNNQLNLIGLPFRDVMNAAFPREHQNESYNVGKQIIEGLFMRRNRIAHQIDRSHSSAIQNDISKEYVQNCISDVENIVNAIYQIAADKG